VAIGAFLVACLAGCAAPALTNVWAEPGYSEPPPSNMLITALRKDPVRRRRWEDAFVTALARRGVKATTSYSLWADAPPDSQQVIDAIKQNHFDGVLSLMRLDDAIVTKTIPGQIRHETVTYQDAWGRAYTRMRDIRVPDQTTTETLLTFQSDFWKTTDNSGRLSWSGTVRVSEGSTTDLVRDAVDKAIMPGLTASRIIPKPAKK
jgi:hypothetical protein